MIFFDDGKEEIIELLKNLIRVGKVSSVDYEKATARVVFFDDDDIVSYDLPVLQKNAFKNKDYCMPDVDECVVCLFLPSGVATGFILGSVYTGNVAPPEKMADIRTVSFADGTRISYDRKASTLNVTAVGNVNVTASNVTVSASNVTVSAPDIAMVGNVVIEGDLLVDGKLFATLAPM